MAFTDYNLLPPTARVWVYQCPSALDNKQKEELQVHLREFVQQWTSHHKDLAAWGGLLHEQFIVLAVDESVAGASGCSIDKSVAFIRQVQDWLGVDLFDRWNFAYWQDEKVKTAQRDDFAALYAKGEITDATLVFNNLVGTKADLDKAWRVELGNSWHKNFVG